MTVRFPIASDIGGDLIGMVLAELRLCNVNSRETVVLFSDTRTNPNYVAAFMAAAKELASSVFEIKVPFLPQENGKTTDLGPVIRATGRTMQSSFASRRRITGPAAQLLRHALALWVGGGLLGSLSGTGVGGHRGADSGGGPYLPGGGPDAGGGGRRPRAGRRHAEEARRRRDLRRRRKAGALAV